jgi:hypothetical protein
MAAVLYANEKPSEDADAALQYLRGSADTLMLDLQRLGLFAASGNATVAMATVMRDRGVREADSQNVRAGQVVHGNHRLLSFVIYLA